MSNQNTIPAMLNDPATLRALLLHYSEKAIVSPPDNTKSSKITDCHLHFAIDALFKIHEAKTLTEAHRIAAEAIGDIEGGDGA
jgi:hypothetical protein